MKGHVDDMKAATDHLTAEKVMLLTASNGNSIDRGWNANLHF